MSNPAAVCEEQPPGQEDAPQRDGEDDLETIKLIATSTAESSNLQDPAILMVGLANPKPAKLIYTKETLMKLRMSPFSIKRPEYLDAAHDNNGIWDPERWHTERKASEGSAENGNRNGNGGGNGTDLENHRRRSGDPKDRLRREHDGIVLSPQRRSFNSGCFVPVREPTRNNRSHSPLGGKGSDAPGHMGHREIPQGPPARRIGSGRILAWDYQEKNDVDNDFGYRRERRDTDRDERFERRSFSRDDLSGSRQPKGSKDPSPFNRNSNRYDRRRVSENKEEEPEWFSEGPASQYDTIELRGFDENEKVNRKKTGAQKKKAKDKERAAANKPDLQPKLPEEAEKSVKAIGGGLCKESNDGDVALPTDKAVHVDDVGGNKEKDGGGGDVHRRDADDKEFNLDDFLQNDIPSILPNGIENQSSGGSRFSQWFKRESPPAKNLDQSRRSSMEDKHHLINTILNDITESTVNIPGDSDSYFAPISPAANTGSMNIPPGVPSQAFIEMLHRSHKQHQHSSGVGNVQANLKNIDIPGKVLILEELEAKMRKGDIGPPAGDMRAAHQNVTTESDENAAFKKLLAQVNAGNLVAANNGPVKVPPAMSLMEMLSHSQKQDEAARMVQMLNSVPAHVTNDLAYKVQQPSQQAQRQQQHIDVLSKINAQLRQPARTPPLNDINLLAASRELLNRPEAQAIFQAMHQRIPSPRELQLHTQHIMHNALIKKKLEEQTENFRKKQESQQRTTQQTAAVGGSAAAAATSKNIASPTQLAWGTPTSVLRKMTADKDESKDANKNDQAKVQQGRAVTGMRTQLAPQQQQQTQAQQQWNAQYQQQINKQGRAIVKNNANYQQVQQQQHDQFLLQQRIFNQQQQRKQTQQQFANMQFAGVQQQFGQSAQFNQHQLRAQHQARIQHQHQQQPQQQQHQQYGQHQQWLLQNQNFENRQQAASRSGANDGDMSPTSNQLARWFSSELLDRARKGKLPNMPPPNLAQHAMSLEEIERQATPVVHN